MKQVGHQLLDIGARPKLSIYIASLRHHRHFTFALAMGRVKASVSGTKLGLLWLLLTPLANAGLFYVVFGVLLGESQSTPKYALFLVTGVLAYSVASRALQAGATAPKTLAGLSGSLPTPKASGDAAVVLTELVSGAWVAPLLVAAALLAGNFNPVHIALGLLAAVLMSVFCLFASLLLAWLARLVPDTVKAVPFVLRAGAFLFGVYFPLSAASEQLGALGAVLQWSPIAVYLDMLRDSIVYGQLSSSTWVAGVAWAVVAAVAALALCWQQENRHG